MELTYRQKLTLEHLKGIGITEPIDIIKFCIEKLDKPRGGTLNNGGHRSKSQTRKHPRRYYQEIINYLAQQPTKHQNSPANVLNKQGS